MVTENKYDCIYSDILLPDGNGLDLIVKLRKNPSAINYKAPVIILTASSNEYIADQRDKC